MNFAEIEIESRHLSSFVNSEATNNPTNQHSLQVTSEQGHATRMASRKDVTRGILGEPFPASKRLPSTSVFIHVVASQDFLRHKIWKSYKIIYPIAILKIQSVKLLPLVPNMRFAPGFSPGTESSLAFAGSEYYKPP